MSARPRLLATTPLFVVSELDRALKFYERLGFHAPRTWGEPPCFAMPRRGEFELMLSLAAEPSRLRPNGPDGAWDVYLVVADLAAEKTALEPEGVALARQPETTEYGLVELEIVDPDGYRICYAQDAGNA